MKNLVLVSFLGLFLVSCKTNSNYYNNIKYSSNSSIKNPYTVKMSETLQERDVRLMSTWSYEEKKEFAEKYFYKKIIFSNDSIVLIK
jgi:hypothetical protein